MAYYSTIPPGYVPYDYPTSTSTSPSPDDGNDYYPPPQFRTPAGSPHTRSKSRNHVRTASYHTPRAAQWTSPVYPAHGHYTVPYYHSSPPPVARYEYVSTKDPHTPRARRNTASGQANEGSGNTRTGGSARRRASVRSPDQPIYVDVVEDGYDPAYYSSDEPLYHHISPRASTSTKKKHAPKADDYLYYTQTHTTYAEPDTPSRSRARRSSTNTRPKTTPVKPVKTPKPDPVATAADAAEHHIPAGYSLKNWDPTEKPILLLGSVFDANSLGKWIYDWSVFHHKPGSPLTDVAGELWLLLIKFAGKMKRSEECLPRIRGSDNRELVRDFHKSGKRIWLRLELLIKDCEEFMWRAAKKEGARGKVQMGEKSGTEFVKSMFGRERELETTEQLMTNIRLWNHRFDANCETILRRT